MHTVTPNKPNEIIHVIITTNEYFPNNLHYPFMIYKQVFTQINLTEPEIQKFLQSNTWSNSWINGIYDYHHYHSNTHEVLVIYDGHCEIQIGGPAGKIFNVIKGDVVIIPAGVSHKKLSSSESFRCIGAYPLNVNYDVMLGKANEHPRVDQNIKNIRLPIADPIFGLSGILFDYWR